MIYFIFTSIWLNGISKPFSFILLSIRSLKSEIPNITGYSNFVVPAIWHGPSSGCLQGCEGSNNNNQDFAGKMHGYAVIWIDASYSSDRYGAYTEVNPLYNSCKYIICY